MQSILLKGSLGTYSYNPAEQILGAGLAKELYKGVETATGKPVALKKIVLNDTNQLILARYQDKASGSLKHLNFLSILDLAQDPLTKNYYAVSRFLDGQTLSEKLVQLKKQGRYLSMNEVKRIGHGVASALMMLHSQPTSLIHGHVNPDHIWVGDNHFVKLMDTGVLNDDLDLETTDSHAFAYMAPERLEDSRLVPSVGSDIYALGITLFQCLTNEVPFRGFSLPDMLQQQKEKRLPQHERITRPVHKFLSNATAKKTNERYQTAEEFRDDLEKIELDGRVRERLKSFQSRSKLWKYGAAAAIFVALGISGIGMLGQRKHEKAVSSVCGNTDKNLELKSSVLPQNVVQTLNLLTGNVDSLSAALNSWNAWFANPHSFNAPEYPQGVKITDEVKSIPENNLLIRLIMDVQDPSLGNLNDRISLINSIPWEKTNVVLKAIKGPLKTEWLEYLTTRLKDAKRSLGDYALQIEPLADSTQNYALLSDVFSKSENMLKASRYSLLSNHLKEAELLARQESTHSNHPMVAQLAVANALACEGQFDSAYVSYQQIFHRTNFDEEEKTAINRSIDDLNQVSMRKDMDVNSDFLRFVIGLHYYYGSSYDPGYQEIYKAKFNCFMAAANGVSDMQPFVQAARSKLNLPNGKS